MYACYKEFYAVTTPSCPLLCYCLDPTQQVKMDPKHLTNVKKAHSLALQEKKMPIKETVRWTGRGKSITMHLLAATNIIPQNKK